MPKKLRTAPAPSTMLASSWSCGTRFSPASTMSAMSGVHCQTSTTTMPIIAVSGLPRIEVCDRIPRLCSSQWYQPKVPL